MLVKMDCAMSGGGGESVDLLHPDIYTNGYASTNTMVNTVVTQKPRYVIAFSSNASVQQIALIIDCDAEKYTADWRWSGSFYKEEDKAFGNLITISSSNVGINFYSFFGGSATYYSINIYY